MDMMSWAENELKLAGYRADDAEEGHDKWLREGVLRLLDVFCDEGHSGSSAAQSISIFQRLAFWKPLTPLTGEDDEWNEVGDGLWQNRRASDVFKDESGKAWWNRGIVFWEWFEDEETGERYKTYFKNKDSAVPIDFPFAVPDEPEYREYQADDK